MHTSPKIWTHILVFFSPETVSFSFVFHSHESATLLLVSISGFTTSLGPWSNHLCPDKCLIHYTLGTHWVYLACLYFCWRKSSRAYNHWLTLRLDLGNLRVLNHSPVLGMYALPTLPLVRVISRIQSWESKVWLRLFGCLNPVKDST